jgi:hypothetical protein
MSTVASRILQAAPLVFLLSLTACENKPLSVELPSFFSAGIEELWFWRLDEGSGTYVRSGHMRLSPVFGQPGAEELAYTRYGPDGEEGLTINAPVEVTGDSIRLELWFARWEDEGSFKLSARNAAGESPLSSDSIML